MADAPASIASDVSFEAALKELEDIVAALEQGDAELERSIQLYERGAALKAHCEAKLRDAQDKVDRIVLDGGPVRSEPADIG